MMRRRRAWAAGVVGMATLAMLGAVPAGAGATAGRGPDSVGQWTLPFGKGPAAEGAEPVAAAMAVLGDGRVLYFDPIEDRPEDDGPVVVDAAPLEESHAQILDLRTGTPQWAAPGNDTDLYCTDLTTLPDGRLLLAGGLDGEGLADTRLFDPAAGAFRAAASMRHGRWYPTLVVGADGDPVVFGGARRPAPGPLPGEARPTETYRTRSDRWEENDAGSESETALPLQPRMVLAPAGRFFYAAAGWLSGPFGHRVDEAKAALFQFYDPKAKRWSAAGPAPHGVRNGAFVVPLTLEPPFERLTLLTGGGGLGPTPGAGVPAVALTDLTTVGTDDGVATATGGDLHHGRWHASAVLLPDGQVLAVGGTEREETTQPGSGRAVVVPELYNPATNEWRPVAPHERARGYHSAAVLLPDMRVLLGGNEGDPTLEIWSPPYLFRGPRPTVVRAPRGVGYGEAFTIATPDAALIESVVLLRTPSPQHGHDSDQRALRLEFTRSGAHTLTATAPPSGAVAPPGTYYLVVNKRSLQGPIPSVARMVDVGRPDGADAGQPFPADAPAPTPRGRR